MEKGPLTNGFSEFSASGLFTTEHTLIFAPCKVYLGELREDFMKKMYVGYIEAPGKSCSGDSFSQKNQGTPPSPEPERIRWVCQQENRVGPGTASWMHKYEQ